MSEQYQEARKIIMEHRNVLDACAALLLEKEKITREEFEALFEEAPGAVSVEGPAEMDPAGDWE